MKSEEFKQRYERAPWGTLSVWPGKPNMGVSTRTRSCS